MSETDLVLLKTHFARAGIPLHIERRPFVRGVRADGIVQMDVHRSRRRSRVQEAIRLYPGHGNDLRVLGIDAALHQLVLFVQEGERTFLEWEWVKGRREQVTRRTTATARRFLLGEDESHLFVAQLTHPATSVKDAHAGLRPAGLRGAWSVRRQGEWFFARVTPAEREVIADALRAGRSARARALGEAGRRGRPHHVDEVLVLADGTTFARGRVRHPDHRTLVLRDWTRVHVNTEDRSVSATWVD